MSGKAPILVTGFGPFGPYSINPSLEVAKSIDSQQIRGHLVHGMELPVATTEVESALEAAMRVVRPAIVLSLGLGIGRAKLAVERVAINALDFPMADNRGLIETGKAVVSDGPDAYLSTLPIDRILAEWLQAGLPGYISNTAGTFLCNQVFYMGLHLAATYECRAGFIHLPCLPADAARSSDRTTPSMSIDLMMQGVLRALAVTLSQA